MNTKTLKALTLAVSLVAGIGTTAPAMATSTGVRVLPLGATAHIYTFTCPLLFPRGRATVQDLAIPFSIPNQLQVLLGQGPLGDQRTDNSAPFSGEGGLVSPVAAVNGVAGLYWAVFKKTQVGNESYTGDLYCTNIFGVRFNPVLTKIL